MVPAGAANRFAAVAPTAIFLLLGAWARVPGWMRGDGHSVAAAAWSLAEMTAAAGQGCHKPEQVCDALVPGAYVGACLEQDGGYS